MMKTIKNTLFAAAALSSLSTVAHADQLSDLKKLFQSLSADDAISTAIIHMPNGYKVVPAADAVDAQAAVMEAPYVEAKVSGYLKAGYIYSSIKDGSPLDESSDVDVEAGVNIKGSVQSELGEVGITLQAKWDVAESANNGQSFGLRDEGMIAFWQVAPELKIEGGRSNAGRLENGIDKNTRRIWTIANRRIRTENAGNGFFDRDMYNGFLGLAYASGPIGFNIRLHDATRGNTGALGSDDDALGVSAKATFSSDMISLEATGGYWDQSNASALPIAGAPGAGQTGVKWLAGVGTELNFIQGLPISLALQMGELHNGIQSLKISGSTNVALSDSIMVGVGAGWTKITNSGTTYNPAAGLNSNYQNYGNHEELAVVGGIYYSPMSYLTLGIEGDYVSDVRSATVDFSGVTGAIVSRYSF